jgi:hypothetical protein
VKVDTPVKSAFKLDLLSIIGIPAQAQEQPLTNLPASGKVVYVKKLRCKLFFKASCWLRKKLSHRYRLKEHLLALHLGVEGGRYNPLVKYVAPW